MKTDKTGIPKMYEEEEIIDGVKGSRGILSVIARRVGCARSTVQTWEQKSNKVAAAIRNERESMKDFTESQLFGKIQNGDAASIFFFLKCQAKERGYVERQQIDAQIQRKEVTIVFDEVMDTDGSNKTQSDIGAEADLKEPNAR